MECSWEERIESAARRDSLDADELAHIRDCSDCRDLAGMIGLMREEGRSAERMAIEQVPSARAILAEARPLLASADVRRVLRPILWLERAAAVLAALTLIGAGWWFAERARDSSTFDFLRSTGDSYASATSMDMTSVSMLLTAMTVFIVASYGFVGLGGTRTPGR